MTDTDQKPAVDMPSEADVVRFLQAHPDFFVTNEYLLKELKLTHRNGSAISLGERQVQVFREHRDQLSAQLNDLVSVARENDRHFEKSKRLLLSLLEVNSLDEVEYVVRAAFKEDEHIDFARVVLFGDPDDYPASDVHIVSREDAREHLGLLVDSQNAVCGRFTNKQLGFIFQDQCADVGSAAVIPLRNGELYGVFALGSKDPEHFESSMGSLFLTYISDFIVRLLPKLLSRSRNRKQVEEVPSLLD